MKRTLTTTALAVSFALLAGCQATTETSEQVDLNAYQCQTTHSAEINDLRIYQVMVESFVNGDDSIGHGTGYGT
ncbi:glycosidase, partial [Vibrio sp. D173a]|nr:glycosidase [Vibrio sp. D173a]